MKRLVLKASKAKKDAPK
jgi:flagellar biosynthesis/type III secretory pathway chaperone